MSFKTDSSAFTAIFESGFSKPTLTFEANGDTVFIRNACPEDAETVNYDSNNRLILPDWVMSRCRIEKNQAAELKVKGNALEIHSAQRVDRCKICGETSIYKLLPSPEEHICIDCAQKGEFIKASQIPAGCRISDCNYADITPEITDQVYAYVHSVSPYCTDMAIAISELSVKLHRSNPDFEELQNELSLLYAYVMDYCFFLGMSIMPQCLINQSVDIGLLESQIKAFLHAKPLLSRVDAFKKSVFLPLLKEIAGNDMQAAFFDYLQKTDYYMRSLQGYCILVGYETAISLIREADTDVLSDWEMYKRFGHIRPDVVVADGKNMFFSNYVKDTI